jgi:integrase
MRGPQLYQRPGSPFYWYRFTLAGKRVRCSTGLGDLAGAEVAAAAAWHQAHQRRGLPVPAASGLSRLGLLELSSVWLAELEETSAKDRAPGYVARFKADLRFIGARWARVEAITSATWLEARRYFHEGDEQLELQPLKWRSVQHLAHTLRTFLRWCARAGVLEVVPEIASPSRKLVEQDQAPRRALTTAERDLLLTCLLKLARAAAAAGDDEREQRFRRAHRIYSVMFWSALRKGEVSKLTLRWIDWSAEMIRIPAKAAKSGQQEDVDLHPKVAAALKAELRARGQVRPDVPVFGKLDLRREFADALKLANEETPGRKKGPGIDLAGLTAHHVARHTCATLAAEQCDDVRTLQAVGRWKSLAMVQKYFHVDGRRSRLALRKL